MKNKKWLLLLIIALPSMMWIILESGSINSYRLNYYGPKIVLKKGDTTFYQVRPSFSVFKDNIVPFDMDREQSPVFAIQFIKDTYVKDGYRFLGLSEYLSYKYEKIKEIPIYIVCSSDGEIPKPQKELEKFSTIKNLMFLTLHSQKFDSINRSYFKERPYYVDEGYIALIDANNNVRGYYDGRYVAEIKRLIDEYRHLRLKEEKQKILNENEIKTH